MTVPHPDPLNAFVPDSAVHVDGAGEGPLAGLRFAAKDIYDIAGHVTGGGNPDWQRTHAPALKTAPLVQTLLDAGATLIGKTITDELTRGILGFNTHYGMPANPRAPDRITGGSSSGSASVVAAGVVDFALGSDTGGSVRVPASFCGIYGIRPTLGRIPLDGVLKQAESYDTLGWFADDPEILARVGAVIFDREIEAQPLSRLVIAEDAFAAVDDAVGSALAPALEQIKSLAAECDSLKICLTDLKEWNAAMGSLHQWEAHQSFSAWIDDVNPSLSYDVAKRFMTAAEVTDQDVKAGEPIRRQHQKRMAEILTPGTVIALPTTPGPAPLRTLRQKEMWALRQPITELTCIAGGVGLPQVSLPLAMVDGLPVGLSLIAPPMGGEILLALTRSIGRRVHDLG